MGKSKKRIFNKITENKGTAIKRNEAVKFIVNNIKLNKAKDENQKLISLFGITIEELLEAGADFEEVSAIKHMFI